MTAIRPRTGNALLRRIAFTDVAGTGTDTDRAATIAIRAVEILRATILQASATAGPVAPPAPAGGRDFRHVRVNTDTVAAHGTLEQP